ncbi:MAG: hypothetical protein J1E97_07310 [Muribaculaceae bacterium]|nr:hypothetical protein [Muribaculaceae bacterium]
MSEAIAHAESQTEEREETTLSKATSRTELTTGATVTEIEIYDTTQPADPATGLPPIKARVKQRHDQNVTTETNARSEATARSEFKADAVMDSTATYKGSELDETVVAASRTPSFRERVKQGAAWATAIIILTAAGWIIYKLKKR